jgi:hypothetical protein
MQTSPDKPWTVGVVAEDDAYQEYLTFTHNGKLIASRALVDKIGRWLDGWYWEGGGGGALGGAHDLLRTLFPWIEFEQETT